MKKDFKPIINERASNENANKLKLCNCNILSSSVFDTISNRSKALASIERYKKESRNSKRDIKKPDSRGKISK